MDADVSQEHAHILQRTQRTTTTRDMYIYMMDSEALELYSQAAKRAADPHSRLPGIHEDGAGRG